MYIRRVYTLPKATESVSLSNAPLLVAPRRQGGILLAGRSLASLREHMQLTSHRLIALASIVLPDALRLGPATRHSHHRLRRPRPIPGLAHCGLHRRLRPTRPLPRRQRRPQAARARREPRRLLRRFHHRHLEARRLFPRQALPQPRHWRADHAADAGALPPGCN